MMHAKCKISLMTMNFRRMGRNTSSLNMTLLLTLLSLIFIEIGNTIYLDEFGQRTQDNFLTISEWKEQQNLNRRSLHTSYSHYLPPTLITPPNIGGTFTVSICHRMYSIQLKLSKLKLCNPTFFLFSFKTY